MRLRINYIGMTLVVLALMSASCLGSNPVNPSSFVLSFPDNVDLGELWLIEDVNCFTCGTGQKNLGRAMGTHNVQLPAAHWFISLRMPKNASGLLVHLSDPTLVNIGDINLSGSDVRDSDMKYLSGINLRSINLSGTKISGEGLQFLKPHGKWIFVDLTNCLFLNSAHLAHFRGWRRSTIRVVPYKWHGDALSEAEQKLLKSARQFICDNQPEEVCGTQIR